MSHENPHQTLYSATTKIIKGKTDITGYFDIVIYSQIMAFIGLIILRYKDTNL